MYLLIWIATAAAVVLVAGQDDDGYTDENRPYKFGFNIQGHQHRKEEKDEKGIIRGEYGFITADGYYRVTVYKTDENGDFKIVSMKNYYVGFPPDDPTTTPEPERVRNPIQKVLLSSQTPVARPTTSGPPQRAALRTTIAPTTPPTTVKVNGAPACSSCFLPPTTTKKPSLPGTQNPSLPSKQNGQQFSGNPLPLPPRSNIPNSLQQAQKQNFASNQRGPIANNQIPNQGIKPFGNQTLGTKPFAQTNGTKPGTFSTQGPGKIPQIPQNSNTPFPQQLLGLKDINQNVLGLKDLTPNTIAQNQPGIQTNQDIKPNIIKQIKNPSLPDKNQKIRPLVQPNQPQLSPKTTAELKPPTTSQNLQQKVLDKSTSQQGQKNLEREDNNLLYRFNYTVGFHGHHEDGYKNGDKAGDYFVSSRDGVSRRVDYIANEFGYQPNITLIELDRNDVRVPKAESEKDYGLKGYEFKWFSRK